MIYTRETSSSLFHLNARDIRDIFCSDIILGAPAVLIRQLGICLQRLNYSCIYALQLYPRWRTLILSWDYIDSHFTVQYAKLRKDEVWTRFKFLVWYSMVQSWMCAVDEIRCVRGPNANRVYVAVDLTNGQLTPNNNTPLLAQALSGEAAFCVVSPALLNLTLRHSVRFLSLTHHIDCASSLDYLHTVYSCFCDLSKCLLYVLTSCVTN